MSDYVIFDGHTLTDQWTIANVDRQPSNMTLKTQQVQGRAGVVLTGAVPATAAVSFVAIAHGADLGSRRDSLRRLRSILQTEEPRPLVFGDDGGKYCNAILNTIKETLYIGKTAWLVSMLIPDPYMYSTRQSAASGDALSHFYVDGTAPAYPVLTMTQVKPSGGYVGVQLDGASTMRVPASGSGGTVRIDCSPDAYTVEGARMITTDSDWWELSPGTHTVEVVGGSATVEVAWHERWSI